MTSTEIKEALGSTSRRLLSSLLRKYVYEKKAQAALDPYVRMLSIEHMLYAQAYSDWVQAVSYLGNMNDLLWRTSVANVFLDVLPICVQKVNTHFQELGIPANIEIAQFLEDFDARELFPTQACPVVLEGQAP